MKREELEAIRHAVYAGDSTRSPERDVRSLLDVIANYESRITWGTTCENCANMLDRSYADYVKHEKLREGIRALVDSQVPGPSILCRSPKDRDDQWSTALRALLEEDNATE